MTQREKNNYKFRVVWRTVLRSFAIKIPIVIPILLLGIGIFFSVALAAFNQQINFQGKLTDSSDLAVSDNTKCMQFLLYNHLTATGDALLWSEEWTATSDATLSTTSGLFSVLLGSNSSLSNVNFNQDPIYLEVQFDASCDATYEEVFSPRKRLGAVPAAFEAKKLVGSTWASPGAIGSTTPNTGAFTTFTASGLATFSYTPQGAGVGQGSLYINPATATADYTLLGLAVAGSEKFRIDAEGDLVKVGNITMPSTGWLGLGSSAGLIGFTDATTDYIYFSNANVGIGTNTPSSKLDVVSDSVTQLRLAYDATNDAQFSINSSGDLTITAYGGDISFANAVIGSATWQAGAIGAAFGGTGLSSFATGDMLYASGATALSKLNIATADYVLTSSGTLPQWSNTLSISGLTVSGLTSSRVSYATTGGQLTDSANLTFDGTTLTAGGFTTTGTLAAATTNISGLATFSYIPQGTGVGQGSLYINPATATADYTLLGLAVGGTEKFKVDAEGDLVKVGNITMPSTGWLGLGSSAGLIGFTDATTDYIYFSNANVGIGTTSPDRLLHVELSSTATSDVVYTQRLSRITSDTAAAGFGTGIEFELENASGTNRVASAIQSVWEDAADATEDASLRFLTIKNGALTEAMRIGDNGNIGIGTTTPGRKLDVLDASNAQLRLTNTAGSVYTEFSVAAVTGNLTVSLSTGDNVIFNKPDSITGANLWVCKGSSCSELSLSDGGNLVVERGMFLADPSGNYFQMLATSDGELWVYDASGDAVLIFDDGTP